LHAIIRTRRFVAEICSLAARRSRFPRTIPLSPYELVVGLRYTRARRGSGRNRFISFIALTSMAGIALGVMALIVVLSVMNGFQEELPQPHPRRGVAYRNPRAAGHRRRRRRRENGDGQCAREGRRPYVLGQAMLSAGETNRGALIRGVDPAREATVADIGTHMRAGALTDLKPGEFGIVLGSELARALGVRMGDPVVVITPQGTMTPAGTLPRLKTFTSSGCSKSACSSSTAAWR
jgi:lipoprotein-releasing system permease protein